MKYIVKYLWIMKFYYVYELDTYCIKDNSQSIKAARVPSLYNWRYENRNLLIENAGFAQVIVLLLVKISISQCEQYFIFYVWMTKHSE